MDIPTFDFTQTLILLLIGLLFFKENVLTWISQFLGLKNNKTNFQAQIDSIRRDVDAILTNHLAHMEKDLTTLKEDVAFIKGKLSK